MSSLLLQVACALGRYGKRILAYVVDHAEQTTILRMLHSAARLVVPLSTEVVEYQLLAEVIGARWLQFLLNSFEFHIVACDAARKQQPVWVSFVWK